MTDTLRERVRERLLNLAWDHLSTENECNNVLGVEALADAILREFRLQPVAVTDDMKKAGGAVMLFELEDAETPPPVGPYTAENIAGLVFEAMLSAQPVAVGKVTGEGEVEGL